MRSSYPIVGAAFCALFLAVACGSPSKETTAPAQPPPPAAVAPAVESPSSKGEASETASQGQVEPQGKGAEVTYTEGTVEAKGSDKDWAAIDIGDFVPNGYSIKTGSASTCILKFGALGAVRIGADSFASVDSLASGARTKSVAIGLDAGTVVCKVRKLASKDSFEVRTRVAVCGVRGTQFMVDAGVDGKAITVAVAEGSVKILPMGFNTIKLRAIVAPAEAGETAAAEGTEEGAAGGAIETVPEAADIISQLSPAVLAGQEARVEGRTMAKINAAYDGLGKGVEIESKTREVISKISELSLGPKVISQASQAIISKIQEVKLDAPPPEVEEKKNEQGASPAQQSTLPAGNETAQPLSREEKPSAQTASAEERPAEPAAPLAPPPIPMRAVVIEASPADAAISLDGRFVASGRYEASLPQDKEYSFTVSKEGFLAVKRFVESGVGDERIEVSLAPVPISFMLASEPPEAMVYVSGQLAGSTPVTLGGDSGQSLELSVQKPGYHDYKTRVALKPSTPAKIAVSLDPIPITVKFSAIPETALVKVDDKVQGIGSCVISRLAGTQATVSVTAPGFATETRQYSFGNADAEIRIRLLALKQVDKMKLGQASICALAWYKGKIVYADGAGTLGAIQVGNDCKIATSWRLQTKNASTNKYSLPISGGTLSFAGSAEWISIAPDTGAVLSREAVKDEYASLSGRPGLVIDSTEIRPRTNGLVILRGKSRDELRFSEGSLMYPVAYGNRAILADAYGTVYFIDPQNAVVESKLPTKAEQPFETGILVDGARGYLVGRLGDLACIDLDKKTLLWQKKQIAGSGATFIHDIQDAGSYIALYSRGRLYLVEKATGEVAPNVIGNLAARPYVDASRILAPTNGGDVAEYLLPSLELRRSVHIGGPIASVLPISEPMPALAVGLGDGTIVIYNPEGEK
jgi:Uncharacterized protein conserved in bacteria